MSLDLTKIRDFGDANYRLKREETERDGHRLVEHEALLVELRRVAMAGEKAERQRAILALRYAQRRKEGLVLWNLDIRGVERKDVIDWARARVQVYFVKA